MESDPGLDQPSSPQYKRILLKLSGEILAGDKRFGLDHSVVHGIAQQVGDIHRMGCEVAIVVGGGNIFRGSEANQIGMSRASADTIGMLGTVINALALQEHLERLGFFTRVLTALKMEQVAEPFIRRRAIRHLEKGRIIILAAGTGNPYFSTDTAAVLRAVECHCDVVLKGTKVNGIHTADPMKFPDAERIPRLGFQEVLDRDLRVMDMTAITLCRENHLPLVVFSILVPGALRRVVCGEALGTIVE